MGGGVRPDFRNAVAGSMKASPLDLSEDLISREGVGGKGHSTPFPKCGSRLYKCPAFKPVNFL
jgi:hypothetical protein